MLRVSAILNSTLTGSHWKIAYDSPINVEWKKNHVLLDIPILYPPPPSNSLWNMWFQQDGPCDTAPRFAPNWSHSQILLYFCLKYFKWWLRKIILKKQKLALLVSLDTFTQYPDIHEKGKGDTDFSRCCEVDRMRLQPNVGEEQGNADF